MSSFLCDIPQQRIKIENPRFITPAGQPTRCLCLTIVRIGKSTHEVFCSRSFTDLITDLVVSLGITAHGAQRIIDHALAPHN